MSHLEKLFYWRGIASDFYNFEGVHTQVSLEKRVRLLNAMGVDTSTSEAIMGEAYDLDIKPWLSWLSKLEVISESNPKLGINFQPADMAQQFSWSISQQGSEIHADVFVPNLLPEVGDYLYNGQRYSRRELDIGALPIGYYEISLNRNSESVTSTLAITPDTSYRPNWTELPESNLWGFVVQLYTLRSASNWGIGDFSDLADLVRHSAHCGADIIGLNPFHALQTDLTQNFSPYAPSDRRFLNPLYIDVERAPGYAPSFRPDQAIETARASSHVNYEAMRSLKYPALFSCFERSLAQPDTRLIHFIEHRGDELIDYASYEACANWQPEAVRPLAQFASAPVELEDLVAGLKQGGYMPVNYQLVAFHCYLQWVAETQLCQAQSLAKSLRMKVGLVRDLAVGASGSGAEAETNQRLFCPDAAIGAPPDPFSHIGQNWGIPPMDPAELRRTGFAHYISLLRSNMANCGALRIDHAMSLYRLWWCPANETADQGAYVYYPFREMLGLLCLESHLNECMVIGEDLGVVPDEFRQAMSDKCLCANRVFYFEKWQESEFKHPRQYERNALAMLDNHDVPTLTAWWNASDLALRDELGLFKNDEEFADQKRIRVLEKQNIVEQLMQNGTLPDEWRERSVEAEIDHSLLAAIVLFVGLTHSQFYVLQLEDLLMMSDPVNVPSTYLEHKNWSRKLTAELDTIFADNKVRKLLAELASVRSKIRVT